ncbi:MAG: hypothetical protein ACI8PT_000609 [Gammaproteobacteria bacterium]|jgi:hypothetical protein
MDKVSKRWKKALAVSVLVSTTGFGSSVALSAGSQNVASAARQYQSWDHKDWRSYAGVDEKGNYKCVAMTGGDGDNSLKLHASVGGGVYIQFSEAAARGYPTSLNENDEVAFVVRGEQTITFDETSVTTGHTYEGIPFAHAGTPDGYVPEMVQQFRAGSTLEVMIKDPVRNTWSDLGKFSLSGFTANFLKISTWCGFDPSFSSRS